jgi:hypothetical protein
MEHFMGWGDLMQRLIPVLNFIDFLKKTQPNIEVYLSIVENQESKYLHNALNLTFFNSFVNHFDLISDPREIFNNYKIDFLNTKFTKFYSFNSILDVTQKGSGSWNIYIDDDNYENFKTLDLDLLSFNQKNLETFNYKTLDNNFPIFNQELENKAIDFLKNNFIEPFESIFYRSTYELNAELLNKFCEQLKSTLDINKDFFVCSNKGEVKNAFNKAGFKVRSIRNSDTFTKELGPGVTYFDVKIYEFLVLETIVLSHSQAIHYCGQVNNISLFNWYPAAVKNVELKLYNFN